LSGLVVGYREVADKSGPVGTDPNPSCQEYGHVVDVGAVFGAAFGRGADSGWIAWLWQRSAARSGSGRKP
jgi:hypothetical protein